MIHKLILILTLVFISFYQSFGQGKWTKKLDLPDTVRIEASSFSINGKGYLLTGHFGANYFRDVWEYDPTTNKWTQKANFPGASRREPVAFVINGKGYLGTGRDPSGAFKDFWEYNPITDLWTKKADFPGGVRRDAIGFSIGNKGYIGTGMDPTGSVNKNDFYEYDPSTDKWTIKTNFPGTSRNAAIGFSIGNKGYIGLGRNASTEYKDIYEYNPLDNTWTKKADFGAGPREEMVSFVIGNIAYVGTGYTSASPAGNRSDFWAFNSIANSWTKTDSLTGVSRTESTAFDINGKGYVCSGYGASASQNDLWEYDPSTAKVNRFTKKAVILYPNPVKQNITLEFEGTVNLKILRFHLYHSSGQEILNINNEMIFTDGRIINISTEHLSNGIYFLDMINEGQTISYKIVVAK